MYLNILESQNPYYNLAFEEVCFRYWDKEEPLLLLWQNDNAIVVGKHQNTAEEINTTFVEEHQIKVVRRITGGGAVYHDLGNINYSIISKEANESEIDFKLFTQPIIDALHHFDIKAELTGRNDLTIDGKKFSGTAQYRSNGQVLHHGTLLFDSDLTVLSNALKVSRKKIESKGIQSVRSRVTNISSYLHDKIDVETFKSTLIEAIGKNNHLKNWQMPALQEIEIERLVESRYSMKEWNYGRSKPYSYKVSERYPIGQIDIEVSLNRNYIKEIRIFGDFFTNQDVGIVENALKDINFNKEEMTKALSSYDIQKWFSMDNKSFINFILNE